MAKQMTWQQAYSRWQKLADYGYPKRCTTFAQMDRADKRIRNAKARYLKLLAEAKARGEV